MHPFDRRSDTRQIPLGVLSSHHSTKHTAVKAALPSVVLTTESEQCGGRQPWTGV